MKNLHKITDGIYTDIIYAYTWYYIEFMGNKIGMSGGFLVEYESYTGRWLPLVRDKDEEAYIMEMYKKFGENKKIKIQEQYRHIKMD